MKPLMLWKIYLLVFISSSSVAQFIDRGYISLIRSGEFIRIPIERITCDYENGITLRAFGRTIEPSCNTIILSIVLNTLSKDPQDLNIEKCWLSVESKNDAGEFFYISFGFCDPFAFYSLSHMKSNKVYMSKTIDAQLHISNIEQMNFVTTLIGSFASSHVYYIEEHRDFIEIQDGQFVLSFESDIPLIDYSEQNQTPLIIESSDNQPNIIIVSQPEALNPEGNEYTEFSSSENVEMISPGQQPDQFIQKKFHRRTIETGRSNSATTGIRIFKDFRREENPTQQHSDYRQEIHTGQGLAITNPVQARNFENNNGVRNSGVQRQNPVVSNPASADDDENNSGTRNSGVRRGGR